jgi:hypothetical protein
LHPLIHTLLGGFTAHRPVIMSPDIIWLTICQGFAQHLNHNAEALRRSVVRHDDKMRLVVRRDDFVKGSPCNPWPEVFAAFSNLIREHVGSLHRLVVADFSTTGPVERAASEVVLLDTVQQFFEFGLISLCGIPSITLEGCVDDWRRIKDRTQEFARFDLEWWINPLQPVLEQFVAAAAGAVDTAFWESFFKYDGASGSDQVSGWVLRLFPCVADPDEHQSSHRPALRRNAWLSAPPGPSGPQDRQLPGGPGRAPFHWNYRGSEYPMEFVGGLIGVAQDPVTLSLRPEIGWAVVARAEEEG